MIRCTWYSGKGNPAGTEIKSVVARGWEWEEGLAAKEHRDTFSWMHIFCTLVVVAVTWLQVDFLTSRLFYDKPDFKI